MSCLFVIFGKEDSFYKYYKLVIFYFFILKTTPINTRERALDFDSNDGLFPRFSTKKCSLSPSLLTSSKDDTSSHQLSLILFDKLAGELCRNISCDMKHKGKKKTKVRKKRRSRKVKNK